MNEERKIPASIGIIMDGNRRWAKAHNLPKLEGHRSGYNKLLEVSGWCKESGIKYLTVYAFSTENWKRSADEVSYLLDLIRHMINEQAAQAKKDHTQLLFPGDLSKFPSDIREALLNAEKNTKEGADFTLAIALSYGGRPEIIDAIHRIPKEKIATLSEEEFSALLWTKDIADPDLVIRTSGEQRLSNFLPWQSTYSELYFTPTLWPDFSRTEFDAAITWYAERDRRKGI